MKSMFAAMMPRRLARPRNLPLAVAPRIRPIRKFWALRCDVDFYKAFLDIYGARACDEACGRISDALSYCCRADDELFARGDGEYVLIVEESSQVRARACAERFRLAVEDLQIPNQASPFGIVTVSLGLATIRTEEAGASERAFQEADAALDRAKSAGRNQVVAASGLVLI